MFTREENGRQTESRTAIQIWECQLKPKIRQQTLEALAYTLNHIYLQDHARPYSMDEESLLRVAEE